MRTLSECDEWHPEQTGLGAACPPGGSLRQEAGSSAWHRLHCASIAAGSEEIKNDVWNQIKLVDANWTSDLICDLSLDESLAPPKKTYTVKSGDTLYKIAQETMGNGNLYKAIVEANGIPNENLIHPGDVLVIPTVS